MAGDSAKSNANRFINAYNVCDYSLRTIYNFKANISFSDLVRRCSSLNVVVRKYEDELLDYARLRNAIIHRSNDMIIAEPHLDVVKILENIAKLISTPPLVVDTVCRKNVVCLNFDVTVKQAIAAVSQTGHSNMPVYKNGTFIGVANAPRLVAHIGHTLNEGDSAILDSINNTLIEEVVIEEGAGKYMVASAKITVDEALSLFNKDRKMICILITATGSRAEQPIGIVTADDVMELYKVLEDY